MYPELVRLPLQQPLDVVLPLALVGVVRIQVAEAHAHKNRTWELVVDKQVKHLKRRRRRARRERQTEFFEISALIFMCIMSESTLNLWVHAVGEMSPSSSFSLVLMKLKLLLVRAATC